MFVVIWEFTVRPEQRAAFERAYGPAGEWAELFKRCPGFARCELLRDAEEPDKYVTLDYWQAPEAYVLGMTKIAAAYQELDARCDAYTVRERRLGNYVEPQAS
jgi:heme-degrading monooxygenase HmoA